MYHKILILLASCAVLTGCSSDNAVVDKNRDGMLNLSVLEAPISNRTEYKVEYRDLYTEVEVSAVKTSMFSDELLCPTSVGDLSLSKLLVEDGALVKEGDSLFEINRTYDKIKRKEKEIEYQRAVEDYTAGCAKYDLAIADIRQDATIDPAVLKLKVSEKEAEYAGYKSSTERKLSKMKAAIDEYDDIDQNPILTVTANADGKFVSALHNQNVTAGKPLATILDTEAVFYIVESNYESFSSGDIVELKSEDGTKLEGKIVSVDSEFFYTKAGGAVIQILSVNGDENYGYEQLPENVTLKTKPINWKSVLTVDTKAVLKDSVGAEYVNLLMENGETERVYVTKYMDVLDYSLIIRGLKEGDICILE